MSKLYLLFGVGGGGLVAAGTGVGAYYGVKSSVNEKKDKDKRQEEQSIEEDLRKRRDGESSPELISHGQTKEILPKASP